MQASDKTKNRLQKLRALLVGKSQGLIVLQDNPDPDALAAAVALRKLANDLGKVACSITHGGSIGRAENRALVRYLQLNLRPLEAVDVEKFDVVAMVDTQPGAGNNSCPVCAIPHIVIDHHPHRRSGPQAALTDIRSNYGATATILAEYLYAADIQPETPLATALLYGIRSDTQDLGRNATRADIDVYEWLYPFANKRMLSEIQRGRLARPYFALLARALGSARIYGPCIISNLGQLEHPDMIAEVADLLLREDDAEWTVCFGAAQGKIYISVRTSRLDGSAQDLVRHIVARKGAGGGHERFAGGQIPLTKGDDAELAAIAKLIKRRTLKELKIEAPAQRLTQEDGAAGAAP